MSRIPARCREEPAYAVTVVTELDGLSKSAPPIGPIAQSAITFLESHIRTHSLSLKVQTSRATITPIAHPHGAH